MMKPLASCDSAGSDFRSRRVLAYGSAEFPGDHLKDIAADRHGGYALGDTVSRFANTAMVLADRGMIPRVFAAVRAISAVRSAAYECGAVAGKDCVRECI